MQSHDEQRLEQAPHASRNAHSIIDASDESSSDAESSGNEATNGKGRKRISSDYNEKNKKPKRESRNPPIRLNKDEELAETSSKHTAVQQWDESTDEESELQQIASSDDKADVYLGALRTLPSFFGGTQMFLYGLFEANLRQLVCRYIVAYNGRVCYNFLDPNLTVVVVNGPFDDYLQRAREERPGLAIVGLRWLIDCHNNKRKLPFTRYELGSQVYNISESLV